MTINNYRSHLLACAFLFVAAQGAAAESIEYTGRVYAERSANLLPLGNGTGAMTVEVAGMAAMSGNPPSIFKLGCAGLGLVDTEGEATMDVYCTLYETDTDAFDLKGQLKKGEGSFNVIGGSGRFAGATGTAKYQRLETSGEGTGTIEVKLRTK